MNPNAVGAGRGTRRPFEKDSRNVETDSSRDRHGHRTMSDSDSQYGRGRNIHGRIRSRHKSEHISLRLSAEMYTVTDTVIVVSIATIVQVHQNMSKKEFTSLTNASLPR